MNCSPILVSARQKKYCFLSLTGSVKINPSIPKALVGASPVFGPLGLGQKLCNWGKICLEKKGDRGQGGLCPGLQGYGAVGWGASWLGVCGLGG